MGAFRTQFSDHEAGAITCSVANIIIHDRYKHPTRYLTLDTRYNIAIIELAQDLDLKQHTPACMADSSKIGKVYEKYEKYEHEIATAFGKEDFKQSIKGRGFRCDCISKYSCMHHL